MSYEILYRRMFVKMSDGTIIPLHESGSNNCYEVGPTGASRRERNWNIGFGAFMDKLSWTPEEIVNIIRQIGTDGGCVTIAGKRHTTDEQLVRWFENGIKRAVTFDFLKEHRIKLTMLSGSTKIENITCSTEQELFDAHQQLREQGGHPYVGARYVPDSAFESLKRKVTKSSTPFLEGFVIDLGAGYGYLTRLSAHKLWHSPYSQKVYRSRASAIKALASLNRKWPSLEPKLLFATRENEQASWNFRPEIKIHSQINN